MRAARAKAVGRTSVRNAATTLGSTRAEKSGRVSSGSSPAATSSMHPAAPSAYRYGLVAKTMPDTAPSPIQLCGYGTSLTSFVVYTWLRLRVAPSSSPIKKSKKA